MALLDEVVDVFIPGPHLRALVSILGFERWKGKHIVEVFIDDTRLDDYPIVVHQRRDDPVWIEGAILRYQGIAFEEVEMVAFPLDTLLDHAQPAFLATYRVPVVVELDHDLHLYRAGPLLARRSQETLRAEYHYDDEQRAEYDEA